MAWDQHLVEIRYKGHNYDIRFMFNESFVACHNMDTMQVPDEVCNELIDLVSMWYRSSWKDNMHFQEFLDKLNPDAA